MNKVIPQVGFRYLDKNFSREIEITSFSDGIVWKEIGSTRTGTLFDNRLDDLFTFKPANDLEWLAVNEPVWDGSSDYPFITKDDDCDNGVDYHSENYDGRCYTRQQWQDKRNELFGEKVVKTKDQLLNEVNISIQDNTSDGIEVNLQESRAKGGPIKATVSNPMHEYSNVTIKPAKKMKVEYEHLTESNTSIWDLKHMLDDEVLFSKTSNGDYNLYSINAPSYMLSHFIEYGVYRRIETEVTWQKEVNNLLDHAVTSPIYHIIDHCPEQFIAMCHLVASMTDKPE